MWQCATEEGELVTIIDQVKLFSMKHGHSKILVTISVSTPTLLGHMSDTPLGVSIF